VLACTAVHSRDRPAPFSLRVRAGGLTKGFRQGTIYCTPATAALVRLKIKVAESALRAVPLGQEFEVEGEGLGSGKGCACVRSRGVIYALRLQNACQQSWGGPQQPSRRHHGRSHTRSIARAARGTAASRAGTRLTFLDANHCPGSAMIAAFPPGGAPPVLHTGDARLTRGATRGCELLQGMRGRSVLVLDTTYADPQYCFPPQQEVVDGVVRAVKVGGAGASGCLRGPK
jgi:Cft2 family RNA processing exonuclease